MVAENCVQCSQDTSGDRRMSDLSSGCSLLQSALCPARPPLLPVTVWGPAFRNQQQSLFHLGIHSFPALIPRGVVRADPPWAEECRLWIWTRPQPLGTLRSSGIRSWSREVHMNQTRLCQPSRLHSKKNYLFFLDFSLERRDPRAAAPNPPITVWESLPEKGACPEDAEQRFRKEPVTSLELSD